MLPSLTRGLAVAAILSLVGSGAQALSMTLADFVANGAQVGAISFSNASVSIKKGLNKNLGKYTVVVSDTGIQLLGKAKKPGSITLQYDVTGASYVGISGVLDLKKKAKGAGTVDVAGTQLTLQDKGGAAGTGSSSFSSTSTLQVIQSLRVKQASRFDFSTSFTKASPPSVPEPSVAALLAAGLAGLGWFGRKRA